MLVSPRILRQASEVSVTNSVHGIIPARSLAEGPASAAAAWLPVPLAARSTGCAPADRPSSRVDYRPFFPTPASSLAAAEAVALSHPARWRKPPARPQADRPAVVLIDNYDSFTYNLAHTLPSAGCRMEVVRTTRCQRGPLPLFGPDGIVFSPGPGTPAGAGVSIAAVRDRGLVTPLLSVCLGHQAIAAAHGAAITTAAEPTTARPPGHPRRQRRANWPAAAHPRRAVPLADRGRGALPRDLIVTARGPAEYRWPATCNPSDRGRAVPP
jgi:hypothetical protein